MDPILDRVEQRRVLLETLVPCHRGVLARVANLRQKVLQIRGQVHRPRNHLEPFEALTARRGSEAGEVGWDHGDQVDREPIPQVVLCDNASAALRLGAIARLFWGA